MPSTNDALPGTRKRFIELRGVVHMHSPYSHDACDRRGLEGNVPNAACLADLRAAPCRTRYDFIALTDHPTHMRELDPAANVLHDPAAGDALVQDSSGVVIGNRMQCPDGHEVLVSYGYEGQHTLPIFFKRHPSRYEPFQSIRPLAENQALTADLHDAGALVALAHSEEEDVDAQTIVEGGIDLMEWYNPHGNLLRALGGDTITGGPAAIAPFFKKLDSFLAGSTSGAHADLFYLLVLQSLPENGFEKWRAVQRRRHVPGILGSDVHQNVSVDPVCKGSAQVLCAALLGAGSKALAQLVSGGPMMMSDGRRFDAFERMMRWLHNRVLVKSSALEDIEAALAHGRSYGVFSVFGDPEGFAFDGTASGAAVDLGDLSPGPVALHVHLPSAPVPVPSGVMFDAAVAQTAEVRAALFRTDANGTVRVAEATGLASVLDHSASMPGSYHVEVWLRPRYLASRLGDQAALANEEYLWIISNPIRVQ